jgi:uncharacterized protein (DUF1697 family)
MQTYISFLRGVNMTGHNTVKMAELLSLYNDLGFQDSETYIQSGNVIFKGADNLAADGIARMIEKAVLDRFGYTIPVMIRTVEEMRSLISVNPFLNQENFEPSKMAVILLYERATEHQIQKVASIDYQSDRFEISGKEIFIYCPNGFGRTKLYTNFFEKKMGVTGTARNWKTITTILNISEKKIVCREAQLGCLYIPH